MDRETAIVVCYTGWGEEYSREVIELWRAAIPGWSAEYMEKALLTRDLERLETLSGETI